MKPGQLLSQNEVVEKKEANQGANLMDLVFPPDASAKKASGRAGALRAEPVTAEWRVGNRGGF